MFIAHQRSLVYIKCLKIDFFYFIFVIMAKFAHFSSKLPIIRKLSVYPLGRKFPKIIRWSDNYPAYGNTGNLLRQAPLLAEEVKIAGLLIRTFSPNFKNKLNFLLRCQIKRQNKTDPEEPYKKLIYIIVGLTLYLENPKRILQYINN